MGTGFCCFCATSPVTKRATKNITHRQKPANPKNKKGWAFAFREIDPGLAALNHSLCYGEEGDNGENKAKP